MDKSADITDRILSTFQDPHGFPGSMICKASYPIIEFTKCENHYLFNKAVKLNALEKLPEEDQKSLLEICIRKGWLDEVRLISAKLPELLNQCMETEDQNFLFPLELAAINKNSEMLDLLLQEGANLRIRNEDGTFIYASIGEIWPEKAIEILSALAKENTDGS